MKIQLLCALVAALTVLHTANATFVQERAILETIRMPAFQNMARKVAEAVRAVNDAQAQLPRVNDEQSCLRCQVLFSVINAFNLTGQIDAIIAEAYKICVNFGIETPAVCSGILQEMVPVIWGPLWAHYTDPERVCPYLKLCPAYYKRVDIGAWVANITLDKPFKQRPKPTGRKNISLLHITDVHTDAEYKEGYNANCDEPLCCRPESNQTASNGEYQPAGYWGTLAKCDIPYRTVQQMINYILKTLPPLDLAIWTGDNTSHDVWHQTRESNLNNTQKLSAMFQKMPNLTFVPSMGNHEPFPVNVYSFKGLRDQYLRDGLASSWQPWIGDEAADEMRTLGYYSVVFSKHNLKVISMNMQSCDWYNWLLIENPTDPGSELQWLRAQLQDAEDKDLAVWIIGHIPVHDCLQDWARLFQALVDRYQYNIRGLFFGHTHTDQFMLVQSVIDPNVITGVTFIAPSVTTESDKNPSFRVFEIDEDTMIPVNYYQYRLNITYWNQFPEANQIEWAVAYNFLEEYGFTNLYDFDQWKALRNDLATNLTVYTKYVTNYRSGNVNQPITTINPSYYCNTFDLPETVKNCNGQKFTGSSIFGAIDGAWIQRIEEFAINKKNNDKP